MFSFLSRKKNTVVNSDPYWLSRGAHKNPEDGKCALEWLSWLEGSEHSDRPVTVDPALYPIIYNINDCLGDTDRQRLRPILTRMIGTRNDGRNTYYRYKVIHKWCTAYGFTTGGVLGVALAQDSPERALEFLNELLPMEHVRLDLVEEDKIDVAQKEFAYV